MGSTDHTESSPARNLKLIRPVIDELFRQIDESGMTQTEVEVAAGFTERYLSRIKHGRIDLKMVHVIRVLRAIGVTPAAFFARLADQPVDLKPAERSAVVDELLARLQASPELRQVIAESLGS